MSDVWISRARWTCKYCNVTINDDAPSRRQHENGFRHKNNVERAVRDATRNKFRSEAEQAKARKEMERIERLARESHAADQVGESSRLSPGTASQGTDPVNKKAAPAWRPKDLASHSDSPLARQILKEEEAALRNAEASSNKDQDSTFSTNVGEWEAVVPRASESNEGTVSSEAPTKKQTYAIREKQGNYDHDEDVGAELKVRTKKRLHVESESDKLKSALPSWTPLRLSTSVKNEAKGGPAVVNDSTASAPLSDVKREEDAEDKVKVEEPNEASNVPMSDESTNTSGASLFKKRRAGSGAGAKKVRAVF